MLSILEREMRVASRKKWTFRIRLWTNVIAFLIAAPMLAIGDRGNSAGSGLFNFLVWISFWFCLLQGVRSAASSISIEKREGTLGLLFLTDLRPIDIVAGKLFGIFLPMIQPLLAFLPALSITILLGGITGGEIFRAGLVLWTTLFFSVSVGLLVSSSSRKAEETGMSTIVFLLLWLFVPLIASGKFYALRYLSLWTAFQTLSDPGYRVNGDDFVYSLLAVNLIAFLSLWAAAYFLPRRWEQHEAVLAAPKPKLNWLNPKFSAEERAKILSRNPGEWLAVRHSMGKIERGLFHVGALGACLTAIVMEKWGLDAGSVPLVIAMLIGMVRLTSQASYPLSEARRSGEVEMILSTPLNPHLLITGQRTALWRQFRWIFGSLVATAWLIPILRGPGLWGGGNVNEYWGSFSFTLVTLSGAVLVAAVGMWQGLHKKSANTAFFMTLVYILGPVFLLFCLWFLIPFYWLFLFVWATDKLSGRNYRKLLLDQKDEKTPRFVPPRPLPTELP